MTEIINTSNLNAGVVGLGLMGCSITTCLLIAGHKIVAVAPIDADLQLAEKRIHHHLSMSQHEGLVTHAPAYYLKSLSITEDYTLLKIVNS